MRSKGLLYTVQCYSFTVTALQKYRNMPNSVQNAECTKRCSRFPGKAVLSASVAFCAFHAQCLKTVPVTVCVTAGFQGS